MQLTRSYKSGDDGWRETDSLGHDDLLAVSSSFATAHMWVVHQLDADRKGRKQAEKA